MTTIDRESCAHLGILEVPPTPTVRHLDELPELSGVKLPVARTPIAPDNAA